MTIDWNTILSAIILGLSTWTLRGVAQLQRQVAVSTVKDEQHEKDIIELRARIVGVETRLRELELRIESCQAVNCHRNDLG